MKIGVIGGAGVRTVIFINGLLKRYKKLKIDEVVLYDCIHEKLAIIEKLCRHVVRRWLIYHRSALRRHNRVLW